MLIYRPLSIRLIDKPLLPNLSGAFLYLMSILYPKGRVLPSVVIPHLPGGFSYLRPIRQPLGDELPASQNCSLKIAQALSAQSLDRNNVIFIPNIS
jgi:hypothetical protein